MWHTVGAAENISNDTVSCAIRKAAVGITQLLDVIVVLPGHLPTQSIKLGFYEIAH